MNIINEIQSSKDYHKTFFDIYVNYKQYDIEDREYCKNYLLIIFNEIFDYEIDLNKINDLLKKNNDDIIRLEQQNFRQKLIDKYKCCVITGENAIGCDAAHIKDLNFDPINYDLNNGLLLNKTLHAYFDNYVWSINPVTLNIEIAKNYLTPDYIIYQYNGKNMKHIITADMIPYLQFKYDMFIQHNII